MLYKGKREFNHNKIWTIIMIIAVAVWAVLMVASLVYIFTTFREVTNNNTVIEPSNKNDFVFDFKLDFEKANQDILNIRTEYKEIITKESDVETSPDNDDDNYFIYTIQSGDTLWSISKRFYGTGHLYAYIMEVNNLASDMIYRGQKLIIKYLDNGSENIIIDEYIDNNNLGIDESSSTNPEENMRYLGKFKVTGYDPYCTHCCARADGITASGAIVTVGKTIAMDKNYPFGTRIYIEGLGTYTVEDRGVKGNKIDVVTNNHDEAYAITGWYDAYIIE